MTIPIRIWMCTVLTMRKFNEAKQDPSLNELVKKLDAVHDVDWDGASEQIDNQVLNFLRRCMEERTVERSAAAQEVSERADNDQKIVQTPSSISRNGASMGSDAAAQEAEVPASTASKSTLKKRRRIKRKRMLKEEQLHEEFERLAALCEVDEGHDMAGDEPVAVSHHGVDTIVEATDELSFTTAPASPFPLSASSPSQVPQPSQPSQSPENPQPPVSPSISSLSEPLPLSTFDTPPSAMRSTSCPPQSSRRPHEMILPLNTERHVESLSMSTPTNHPSRTSLVPC